MFLQDITPFEGNGQKNAKGQTLQEFLQSYDPHRYDTPSVTTDIIVLQVPKGAKDCVKGGRVLLIRRGNHPCIGMWALPGGFVDMKENLVDGARRELREETGVSDVPLEAVGVWGDWQRDPRTRVITVPHLAILEEEREAAAGDDAGDARWFSLSFAKTGEEEADGVCRETWALTLTGGGETLCPVIERSYHIKALLQQEAFRVKEPGGVAVDHSAILLQALLHARRALQQRG